MKKLSILNSLVSLLVLGLISPIAVFAAGPATVNLLSAGNYVILAKTAITTTPGVVDTSITGDVGISPAFASDTSGFGLVLNSTECFSTTVPTSLITGKLYAADYNTLGCTTPAVLTTAVSAMEAAYTDAHDRTPGTGATNLNVGGGTLNGQNFVPGTYTWNGPTSNVTITGDITITGSASDIWIFQVAGTLDLASGKKIILAGGAQPQNIFWQVAGAVNLISGSQFQGIILAQTNIAMGDGATLNGRALAQTAVTLIGNTILISNPVVVAPIIAHRRSTPRPVSIVPIIGLLKIPTPLALPTGPGQVTYNYSVWNVAKLQQLTDISVVDDKCSPVVLVSGDTNNNGELDLDETWNYSCTSMLTSTTTNTAIATAHSTDGYYNTAIATAITTVVVGTPIQPPLIHIVKVPSQLASLPFGGGDITYSYTVTNPGPVAMKNVNVTDDKCTNVTTVSVDQNSNGLLDTNETWTYTCKTNVKVSTGSVATAKGDANGLTALAYAFTNVLVAAPSLPNTGLTSEGVSISWSTITLSAIIIVLGTSLVMVMKKRRI